MSGCELNGGGWEVEPSATLPAHLVHVNFQPPGELMLTKMSMTFKKQPEMSPPDFVRIMEAIHTPLHTLTLLASSVANCLFIFWQLTIWQMCNQRTTQPDNHFHGNSSEHSPSHLHACVYVWNGCT